MRCAPDTDTRPRGRRPRPGFGTPWTRCQRQLARTSGQTRPTGIARRPPRSRLPRRRCSAIRTRQRTRPASRAGRVQCQAPSRRARRRCSTPVWASASPSAAPSGSNGAARAAAGRHALVRTARTQQASWRDRRSEATSRSLSTLSTCTRGLREQPTKPKRPPRPQCVRCSGTALEGGRSRRWHESVHGFQGGRTSQRPRSQRRLLDSTGRTLSK